MKPFSFRQIAALALPTVALACSHDERPATTGYEPAMTPAARAAAPSPEGTEASEKLDDPQIMSVVRAANIAEVDQARTALGRVHDDSVKKFAEMMLAQHGQAVKNIDALDTKLGFQPADSQLGTELGVNATRVERQLSQTNDASIDRLYITAQIDAHRQLLDAIDTRLVPAARHDEVKDLLQTTRPLVEGHLKRAQEILDSLK